MIRCPDEFSDYKISIETNIFQSLILQWPCKKDSVTQETIESSYQ